MTNRRSKYAPGAPALAGILLALCVLLKLSLISHAGEPEAVEVQTGWSESDIESPQDPYQTIPVHLSYYYSAEPWLAHVLGHRPDGTWQYFAEPFVDPTVSPSQKAEVGFHLGFKISTPLDGEDGHWRAFVRGGTGPMITLNDTLEESTKFQFGSYYGGGLSYALDDHSALTLEVRERHMSNASIKRPNSGVNSNVVMLGYYWQIED